MDQTFCNKIAQLCLNSFNQLPQSSKPASNEWTVLSCIVKENKTENFEVIALGTGSKCIGFDKMSEDGTVINDSHAEILARRSFLLYLYNQILNSNNKDSIFFFKNGKFQLVDDIKFHFFSTLMPCGDCNIFPKDNVIEEFKECANSSIKRLLQNENSQKKIKIEDIYRTGAKCLPTDEHQDPKTPGVNYHVTGVVRTKPGRGPPTFSVSCSDKLAKWCHIGIQGALLSFLLKEPIFLSSITIVGNTHYSDESMYRALIERFPNFKLNFVPKFYQAVGTIFNYQKDDNKKVCSFSIAWCKIQNTSFRQTIVEGRKQGTTSKNKDNPKLWLEICKRLLFNKFFQVLRKFQLTEILSELENSTYYDCKQKAQAYQEMGRKLKDEFKHWPFKDKNLLQFKSDI